MPTCTPKIIGNTNVNATDDGYDVESLQEFNDYLFIFAIDQHIESSNEGDISDQRWVEQPLMTCARRYPSERSFW